MRAAEAAKRQRMAAGRSSSLREKFDAGEFT
jgi:hypothetical protein